MEPNAVLINFVNIGVPFMAYFIGIIIRKVALPGKDSPSLAKQLLLGIPISLVIVAPTLAILKNTLTTDLGTYLLTIGVIMEHGMIVTETALKHMGNLIKKA
jgi:hypothetical protein